MTLRTMLGIGWALLIGLAGGWLVLMPWALHVQGGGDWTTVTRVSFGTGVGLLVFCLVGFAVTGLQIARALARPRRAGAAEAKAEQEADQESLDKALLQLATKLVTDLEAPAGDPAAAVNGESSATAVPAPAGVARLAGNGAVSPPRGPSGAPEGRAAEDPAASGDGAPAWRRVES